ncbi:recombinase family protein [Solihabitans fulvus]|uniref:Recombinase family protein n=1 Tax=Solihabitans fulvus TaxID=1892852 RepID=A0A5B2XU26_9PSEU|nr:recombinase family protein [Solihabitans fulvus]KAA2267006.1 recombinase family protein [Solihabitans fulvus]
MAETVGIYARISEDPLGLEKGVQRQVADGLALCERRGWTVSEDLVFVDNDLSALKGGPRPEYDKLIDAAMSGKITRIVAFQMSRLWRNRRERVDAIEKLAKAGVSVALVKGSDIDMTSAHGRALAGLLGEFDTMESEVKAERVEAAARQRAEEGKANGAVLYGWQRVKVRNQRGDVVDWYDEINPEQAAIVREIVDRLLARESLKAITADFNARSVPTAHGGDKPWRPSSVRKLAIRLANIGRRARGGEDFGPAAWPPIVDRDLHDQVVALVTDPSRVKARSGARTHLLTFGIGRCGKEGCGAHLRVTQKWLNPRHKEMGKTTVYVCDGPSSCVGRRQAWVDDLVERVVVRRLQEPDARDLLTRDDREARAARDRAEGIRSRLDAAADDFATGDIDREQLRRISAKLRPDLLKAERQAMHVVQGMPADVVADMVGPQAKERWQKLAVTQKRALLEAMAVTVTIMPARGGPGFKPESVKVRFERDGEQNEAVDGPVAVE